MSNRALLAVLMTAAVVVELAIFTEPQFKIYLDARSAHVTRSTYMFSIVSMEGGKSRGGSRSGVKQAEKPLGVCVRIQNYRKETTSKAAVVSRNDRSEETRRKERS